MPKRAQQIVQERLYSGRASGCRGKRGWHFWSSPNEGDIAWAVKRVEQGAVKDDVDVRQLWNDLDSLLASNRGKTTRVHPGWDQVRARDLDTKKGRLVDLRKRLQASAPRRGGRRRVSKAAWE